jgi:hypothetical protein
MKICRILLTSGDFAELVHVATGALSLTAIAVSWLHFPHKVQRLRISALLHSTVKKSTAVPIEGGLR